MQVYKTMENGVVIAEYEDSTAGLIADMWNRSRDSWGGDDTVMTASQAQASYSGGSYFNIFVALDKGEAVGLCTFGRYYKDAETAYVNVLNVRPDYHGKKVGKELVLACVRETIKKGYPRVDIHTWAGNTKAVPLYKKCGFLWEDRGDTTHLSNFVPTVLNTELCADFFKDADWYYDMASTREIVIKPDGVKTNNFEFYGYVWEKDGKRLAVGFEKTGRRIRIIETDDYKIELTAGNHELAFGLSYDCAIKVENKTGASLDVKIAGKNDREIKFDLSAEASVEKKHEFAGRFYVEKIVEEIDREKMHPCLLADIYINGKHAELGLGIEPKYPLSADFVEKRHQVVKTGTVSDVYINLKSALPEKATVSFKIPQNKLTQFGDDGFMTQIEPEKSVMLKTDERILSCGYQKVGIEYSIILDDGRKISFSKPLHLVNHSPDSVFCYENEKEYCAVDGLWKLIVNKHNNSASFINISGYGGANFRVPKLGKPYTDELDLIKASEVKMYSGEKNTVVETVLESHTYKGVAVTIIYEFNASGVISRRFKLHNRSDKTVTQLFLQEQFWSDVARRCILHYDGGFHEVSDDSVYAFGDLDNEKIDENWIFDNAAEKKQKKSGMYWNKNIRPKIKWGDELVFDHEADALKPGEYYETEPCFYMSGVFNNFYEFRNYVLGKSETEIPYTAAPLNMVVNGGNPFIDTKTEKIEIMLQNNRTKIFDGRIEVSSPDGVFETQIQTNPEKEMIKENRFVLPLVKKDAGIFTAQTDMDFPVEIRQGRALFVADSSKNIEKNLTDGIYTADNGCISFKTAPEYSDGIYSLKYGENEWLFTKYPNHEPYAWSNPFIGGLGINLWNINENLMLREKKSACFVTVCDSFATEWSGIKTTTCISSFTEHKGLTCEQYFLTRPSLPVMCHFVNLINGSGASKNIGYYLNAFITGGDKDVDLYAQFKAEDKTAYRARMSGNLHMGADRLINLSFEGKHFRSEKLALFSDGMRNQGGIGIDCDIYSRSIYAAAKIPFLKDGDAHTFRPLFFVFSDRLMNHELLGDLNRVYFKI